MSTSRTTNGSITLKSFAELGSVLDLTALPAGDEEPSGRAAATDPAISSDDASALAPGNQRPEIGLADVVAQLASMRDGLEAAAREDVHARDEAALELARYEALLAETEDAE